MSGSLFLQNRQKNLVFCLFIFVIGLILFLPRLGDIGLFDPSDAYYSEGAREMLERGNLLVPYLNYENYYEKPILNYWLIAASYKIFGISPFAARVPAALSAVLSAVVIFFKSRRYIGEIAACAASLIFLTSPIVLIVGRFSLTDMPLCLFETASSLFLFEAIFARRWQSLLASYICLAFAILMKGPIAAVVVGGTMSTFVARLAISRRRLSTIVDYCKRINLLLGLGIVCSIALPWYLAVHFATDGQFTQTFFVGQNIGRALGKVNHTAPFFYYIPIFLGSFFPWSILLATTPQAGTSSAVSRRTIFIRYCVCWAAFLAVFFSITPTKLPTYILPMYPPCAIILACALTAAVKSGANKSLVLGAVLLSGISCLFAIVLPLFITGAVSMKTLLSVQHFVPGKLAQTFRASYFSVELWAVSVAATSVAYLALSLLNMSRQALIWLMASLLTISACLMPLVLRHFYSVRQSGFAKLVRIVQEMNAPVATIEAFQPSACFTLHKHLSVIKTPNDLEGFLSVSGNEHLLLVPDSRLSVLLWLAHPPKFITSCGGWTLVSIK